MLLGECYAGEDAEVLFEAMKADWSGEDEDVISNLVVYVKRYKQTAVQAIGATAVWISDMGMYLLTVPAAYVPAAGSFDIVVKGAGDIDDVKIRLGVNTADTTLSTIDNVVDGIKIVTDTLTNDYFELRVATALEGYNTSTLTAQQVWEHVTRTLTSAGAGGATAQEVWEYATRTLTSGGTATSGGSESIITGYTHVASARTIDTGDTALTVEQIISIFNLSQGCEIYNCLNPRKHRMYLIAPDNEGIDISITNGVITYIEDSGMTNDDKLMIIVRSAHTTI